jgi:hypothetical protein
MSKETSYHSPLTAEQEKAADQLKTLRYWLATEDIYTSTYVREWLERTPVEEAADVLARIAENAQPEPHSLWYMFSRGFTMMFTTSEIISDKSPAGRKAGIRAALLLADMDDPRCLPPLARAFETTAFWEGKYQEAIEETLLRFLSEAVERPDIVQFDGDATSMALQFLSLRLLAVQIWQSGRGRKELSTRRANLLIATIQCQNVFNEALDGKLIGSIIEAKAATPNRDRVKQAAIALLENPPPY